jgi:hypothetical protein
MSGGYSYVVWHSPNIIETPPVRGVPTKAPEILTNEWIAGEISKAQYRDLKAQDTIVFSAEPSDENYWNVSSRTHMYKSCITNVSGISKGKSLIVLDSNNYMAAIVSIYEDTKERCVNMLFLYAFGQMKAGFHTLLCVAHYSKSLFGESASIMAINPLTPLYRLMDKVENYVCVLIDTPADSEEDSIIDSRPIGEFSHALNEDIKQQMKDAIENNRMHAAITETSSFGILIKASDIL